MKKFRIGLFTSAWGKVSWELVEEVYRNVQSSLIPNAEIAFVFVSREKGETHFGDLMIDNVQALGLPLITFSSARFKPELREKNRDAWRLEHDQELMKLLPSTDLIVLLGYMWWFSKEMCDEKFAINLHPALPGGPKGTYREVIQQLIQEGATETGAMMHLVTPERDRGPVISFCRFPIKVSDFDWIRQNGVIREFPLIVRTIKMLVEGGGQVLLYGHDLTKEIDAVVVKNSKGGASNG